MIAPLVLAMLAAALPQDAPMKPWEGPGRFCGYSPIIDLREGERIDTRTGGIHSGSFRWTGRFGTLEVTGIGWASRPRGRAVPRRTAKGHVRFAERLDHGMHVVAIWNGRAGAAYFRSPQRITREQLAAIDRVGLFQEDDDEPEGCRYRTIFSWGE